MTRPTTGSEPDPWRVPVIVAQVPDTGLHRELEASVAERQAMAEIAGLREVLSAHASFDVVPKSGGRLQVTGLVRGRIGQTCVVTLEPVPAHVSESFDALFAPPSMIEDQGLEVDFDPSLSDEDIPEPMDNNRIDIGELTAQHLSLGLDPYPHAEGVEFEGYDEEPVEEEVAEEPEKPNPFAVLQQLKSRN